ncbi:MAG: 2-C-methyl-D-erythritol 4-phosphate cytidylyltransferase [Verrucomicrobiae bacterium]|nr:2-C-methyl-D-erythritol 4-phosphate cytidylyltransferase [Verrucomicrobiae bacterium]
MFSQAVPARFGGAERQDSVSNGVRALDPAARWVAIQDAPGPAPRRR